MKETFTISENIFNNVNTAHATILVQVK